MKRLSRPFQIAAHRRFVRRLLAFIGCRDEMVNEACRTLGIAAGSDHNLLGVA